VLFISLLPVEASARRPEAPTSSPVAFAQPSFTYWMTTLLPVPPSRRSLPGPPLSTESPGRRRGTASR